MKSWKWYGLFVAILGSSFLSLSAFADDVDLPIDQFFNQVLDLVKSFGGIPWTLKVAGIITLIISTMKVSLVKPLWDKLGWIKGFAGAILGAISGALILASGSDMTLAGVAAYFFAGAGSIVLHQMLDALKTAPFVGAGMLQVIDVIKGFLKAPQT